MFSCLYIFWPVTALLFSSLIQFPKTFKHVGHIISSFPLITLSFGITFFGAAIGETMLSLALFIDPTKEMETYMFMQQNASNKVPKDTIQTVLIKLIQPLNCVTLIILESLMGQCWLSSQDMKERNKKTPL